MLWKRRLIRNKNLKLVIIFCLLVWIKSLLPTAFAQDQELTRSLAFTIFLDGYVMVEYELLVNHDVAVKENSECYVMVDKQLIFNQTYPSVNITLFGQTLENLIITDENGLPLDYSLNDSEITIYSLGASKARISYSTQDLTSKTGRYWTLTMDVPINCTILLPIEASIVSLNVVPNIIESSDSQIKIVMPSGFVDITYVIKRLFRPTLDYGLLAIIVTSTTAVAALLVYSIKKITKRSKLSERRARIDIEKIYKEHRNLRPEEKKTIQLLIEKQGTAFEAELYAKLNMPRTTTWRMIKRLQGAGIIDIIKSRRQNVVSIKKRYHLKNGLQKKQK